MRRTRRTAPTRGPPPQRKTRLRPVNPERRANLRAVQFGPQAALCRRLPCCVCGSRPTHAHHVVSRGAGGEDRHTVPLCWSCHGLVHRLGRETFERRHAPVKLRVVAARLHREVRQ